MRTRKSHKGKQDPKLREIKQADLDMLELAAATREIDLKYLDESGFCAWEVRLEKYTQPYLGVYLLGRRDLGVRAECIFFAPDSWE